jgi:hypothetical protein
MGAGASASGAPQSPLALVAESDRRRLDDAKQAKVLIDLAELSPESVAQALACYIPNFVPNEALLQSWLKGGGSERTVDGLRRLLRDHYGLDGNVPLEAVARATMEWHVQYYFNTPLVVPDPYAKAAAKEAGEDSDDDDDVADLPRMANPGLRRASLPPLCQSSGEHLRAVAADSGARPATTQVAPLSASKKGRKAESMLHADALLAQAMMGVLLRRLSTAPGSLCLAKGAAGAERLTMQRGG